jgi:diacylglycerol kinase family enzyme
LGGGLGELREELARQGVADPIWYEVPKSKQAPKQAKRAVADGADLVFVWGGDGMVQRSVDALADSKATIAILPAGTANLLATNLGFRYGFYAVLMRIFYRQSSERKVTFGRKWKKKAAEVMALMRGEE